MPSATSSIYFGGPDLQKNLLRDILLENIEESPSGSNIIWICYYLQDPLIIDALIHASDRGVFVEALIDSSPRIPDINYECIKKLSSNNNSVQLTLVQSEPLWEKLGIHWHAHLHSKLYYFSHPKPHALIGSYNPTSGQDHLDNMMLAKIGDHSISHNVLVDITNKEIVNALHDYAHRLNSKPNSNLINIFQTKPNYSIKSQNWELTFLPSKDTHPTNKLFSNKDDMAKIKCAISHLKGPFSTKPLKLAAKMGKEIEVILDASERRIPTHQLSFFDQYKIKYHRQKMANNCLMHNKFIIYQSNQEHCVMFGSFNWSTRSRLINHEIIACSRDRKIVAAFEDRWNKLVSLNV